MYMYYIVSALCHCVSFETKFCFDITSYNIRVAPPPLQSTVKASAKERLEKVLRGFDDPLLRFTQFMLSINSQPVPQNIRVS